MTVRDLLARVYYGNPLAAWLVAVAVLVGGWAVLVLLRRAIVRRLERFAARTSTSVDDLALRGLRRTSKGFLFVLALTAAEHFALLLPPNVEALLHLAARLAFLLQAARWGNGAIGFWMERVTRQSAETDKASLTTIALLGVLARVVLWAFLFILALGAFGIDVTALVTGLGIAGVAVALAVQNVLGDVLASLAIALDKPFVIGDSIAFETFNGTVEDIGLKTTRLRSQSGEQIIVANAELLKARIRNFQRQAVRRVVFTTALAPDVPPALAERAPQLVREIVAAQPDVRLDRSHLAAMSDSALTLETVYFMQTADYGTYMDTQQRVLLAILQRFREEGIALAPPPRTIVVVNDGAGGAAAAGQATETPPAEAEP